MFQRQFFLETVPFTINASHFQNTPAALASYPAVVATNPPPTRALATLAVRAAPGLKPLWKAAHLPATSPNTLAPLWTAASTL